MSSYLLDTTLAELVQYKCGLVVDTPVHLAKLSVETVEAIQHKATCISVTVAEGESKGSPAGYLQSG
jgi:hypothetical protein